MNPTLPNPVGTTAAAGGAGGAMTVVLVWLAAQYGVQVPGEVAASVAILLGTALHWLATIKAPILPTPVVSPVTAPVVAAEPEPAALPVAA